MEKLFLKFLTDYYSIVSIAFWLEYEVLFMYICFSPGFKERKCKLKLEKKLRNHKGCSAFISTDMEWTEGRENKQLGTCHAFLTLSLAILALQHWLSNWGQRSISLPFKSSTPTSHETGNWSLKHIQQTPFMSYHVHQEQESLGCLKKQETSSPLPVLQDDK